MFSLLFGLWEFVFRAEELHILMLGATLHMSPSALKAPATQLYSEHHDEIASPSSGWVRQTTVYEPIHSKATDTHVYSEHQEEIARPSADAMES